MQARKLFIFPTYKNKNIKLYYFLTAFMNGWFILPNWVFYFAKFISIIQVGIIDGISKLVAVFLEVPSGAVSDLVGKKKTLIFGNAFLVLSCLTLIYATNFLWLLIGNIFMFIGFAFISGSKEALLYDSLIDIKKEKHYDEVLGKVNSIATFVTILSIFAGGLLFRFNPRYTFVAWAIFSLVSIFILMFMKEPLSDEEQVNYYEYFSKLKSGVSSIFTKSVVTFVLPVLFFSMLIKSYEGVIRQNTGAYFGFTGETFGYLMALISIPTLFVSYNYNKIAKKLKGGIEYLFIGLYALGFLIVYLTNSVIYGIASFILVYTAQEIVKPYVTSLVNRNTLSKHRATALSTVNLFSEFPYMIIVLFLGPLIEVSSIKFLYLGFIVALGGYIATRLIKDGRQRRQAPTIKDQLEQEPIYTRE
jgi:MFS family permease